MRGAFERRSPLIDAGQGIVFIRSVAGSFGAQGREIAQCRFKTFRGGLDGRHRTEIRLDRIPFRSFAWRAFGQRANVLVVQPQHRKQHASVPKMTLDTRPRRLGPDAQFRIGGLRKFLSQGLGHVGHSLCALAQFHKP